MENTDPRLDNRVSLDDPRMRALLRETHVRGHEIGIHPGYHTFRYPEAFAWLAGRAGLSYHGNGTNGDTPCIG